MSKHNRRKPTAAELQERVRQGTATPAAVEQAKAAGGAPKPARKGGLEERMDNDQAGIFDRDDDFV